jgi:hypothetical protein
MKKEKELLIAFHEFLRESDDKSINWKAKMMVDVFMATPQFEAVEKEDCPEWLTPLLRKQVGDIWHSHRTTDDGLRVKAIQTLREASLLITGCKIGLKQAVELTEKYCINTQ